MVEQYQFQFLKSGSLILGNFQFEISGEIGSTDVRKFPAADSVITVAVNTLHCTVNQAYIDTSTFFSGPISIWEYGFIIIFDENNFIGTIYFLIEKGQEQ